MQNYLAIGDHVLIPREIAILSHPDSKAKRFEAIIDNFYPSFFNVTYSEGFQQSIQYSDINKIRRIGGSPHGSW